MPALTLTRPDSRAHSASHLPAPLGSCQTRGESALRKQPHLVTTETQDSSSTQKRTSSSDEARTARRQGDNEGNSDPTPLLSPPRRKGVSAAVGSAGWDRACPRAWDGERTEPRRVLSLAQKPTFDIRKSPGLPGCGVQKPLTSTPPCLSSHCLVPTPQGNRSGEVAGREQGNPLLPHSPLQRRRDSHIPLQAAQTSLC